jgi:uncharacterized protein DUF1579
MQARRSLRLTTALLGLTALAMPAVAQTNAKEAEKPYDADLSRYYGSTNENHRALDGMSGKWKGEITIWTFGDPPPHYPVLSTMENKWLWDGRFLESHLIRYDGITPEKIAKGTVYEGVHYYGYDNKLKHYWTEVIGNDHTTTLRGEGQLDPQTKILRLSGPELSPVSGDTFTRIEIYGLKNKDAIDWELRYAFPDGSEILAAKGTFHRVP